jgi:hypothetical protein
MKFPKWQEGRQGTGYKVLTLINSKFFKFDCHILKYPEGSSIPPHKDPAKEGYEHYRLNITLKRSKIGGYFNCANTLYRSLRVALFRPDLETHSVMEVLLGTRYVLSIGWLKKIK